MARSKKKGCISVFLQHFSSQYQSFARSSKDTYHDANKHPISLTLAEYQARESNVL